MTEEEALRKLIAKEERRIRRFFELAIQEYRESLNLSQIARFIEAGDFVGALDEVDQVAFLTVNASQQSFMNAAQAMTAAIEAKRVITIGFDQVNRRAVDILERNKLEFVQQFTEQQRAATRAALVEGVQRGQGPRQLARGFRDSIGLTQRQEEAVANYRRLLQRVGQEDVPSRLQREFKTRSLRDARRDGTVLRAIKDKRPLSSKEIDSMVERYRDRAIKHRAVTISRTEALSSVHEGQDNAINEAIRNGAINEQDALGEWITGQDGRQRDPHQELHRDKSPIGVPFVNSLGEIMYPGDRSAVAANVINCRCARVIRVKG